MTDPFEEAKAWGREVLLRSLAEDLARESGLSVEDALAAIRKAAEPPPAATRVEEFVREAIREALANMVVYGQHPPPPQRPDLQGIGPPYASVVWPHGRGFGRTQRMAAVSPLAAMVALTRAQGEVSEDAIERIIHDPLWGLERSRAGA